MDNPKCRYCGNPMNIEDIEYTDIYYKCDCDGYKKEKQLIRELLDINSKRRDARDALIDHIHSSKYHQEKIDLEHKQYVLNREYEEEPVIQ